MSALAEVKEAEPEAAPLSPRQQLGAAIARCNALRSEIASNKLAIEAATEATWEASAKLEAARETAANAPSNAAKAAVAAKTAGAATPDKGVLSMRDARAALEEAQSELDALREYRTELETQELRLHERLNHAEALLQTRLGELVGPHPSTQALLAEYKATQIKLIGLATTIGLLSSRNCLAPKDRTWEATPIVRVQYDPAWFAALDGLQRDAATVLPLPD